MSAFRLQIQGLSDESLECSGGFVVESHLGWRWTAWLTMILAGAFGVLSFALIPETHHPSILQRRAARMRRETGHWAYHSQLDETTITARDILVKYLLRPCAMLVMEPILLFITIYISLIYGILYLFFVAYPISFREVRGWNNLGVASLPLLSVLIGVMLGSIGVAWSTRVWYQRKIAKFGKATPEDRLPPMMVGAVFLPVRQLEAIDELNPADNCCCCADRSVLVRMDLRPACVVGTAGHCRHPHRYRDNNCLASGPQLHHRRLPHVCQLGHLRQHARSKHCRRRLPVVCDPNVPQAWSQLGHVATWVSQRCNDTYPHGLLSVRGENPVNE